MGVGAVAGRAAGLLGKYFVRFGRISPWVTVGLTGATIGGVVYKHKKDESRINELIEETFRNELREQDLWNNIRSQVSGASEDLYKTFTVYRAGEVKPHFRKGHAYKPQSGEVVECTRGPYVNEAYDLVDRAVETLGQSKANELSIYKDAGKNPLDPLIKDLKRVKARLKRAKEGNAKNPDYAGMQKQLNGFVEANMKPTLSDLSFTINQGAVRVRDDYRKGLYKKKSQR